MYFGCQFGMCMGPMLMEAKEVEATCSKEHEPCTTVADCCDTLSSRCNKNGKCRTVVVDPDNETITDYIGDLFDEILN